MVFGVRMSEMFSREIRFLGQNSKYKNFLFEASDERVNFRLQNLIFTWRWSRYVLWIRFSESGQSCGTNSEQDDKDCKQHREATTLRKSLQGLRHGRRFACINPLTVKMILGITINYFLDVIQEFCQPVMVTSAH